MIELFLGAFGGLLFIFLIGREICFIIQERLARRRFRKYYKRGDRWT